MGVGVEVRAGGGGGGGGGREDGGWRGAAAESEEPRWFVQVLCGEYETGRRRHDCVHVSAAHE